MPNSEVFQDEFTLSADEPEIKVTKKGRKKAIILKSTDEITEDEAVLPEVKNPDGLDTPSSVLQERGSGIENTKTSHHGDSGKIDNTTKVKIRKTTKNGKKPCADNELQNPSEDTSGVSDIEEASSGSTKEATVNPSSSRSRKKGKKAGSRVIKGPSHDLDAPKLLINDLSKMPIPTLRKFAEDLGLLRENLIPLKKQELIHEVLTTHIARGGVIYAYGSLEILPDGYGFLRLPQNSYLPGPDDIYISPSQIRLFNLKIGDTVYGQIRSPKETERYFAMLRVVNVNFDDPEMAQTRVSFANLTPLYPTERLNMETAKSDPSTRIINLFSPIGKGQRGLIVSPPKSGKTVILQKIANAITENHPDIFLIVLLIDERPEEVTDMQRSVQGEVVASTFDEQATRHVQVAEMVLEKARRLVEHKKDVVILLDSITRLARAYNQTVPTSGKILSGGVDSNALHKPKRFFGAARNIEDGGSLTIVATALIETGSRMDEVIFEEFKGTGNMELSLERRLADKRVYPAFNVKKSSTRKEDLLLTSEELNKMWILRKVMSPMDDLESTEMIVDKMRKTKNNEAFLKGMNTSSSREV